MSTAAAGLITALNSSKTVKSTTNMLKTTKELNKAQENGAIPALQDMFQTMSTSGPASSAMGYFMAQIQSKTVGSNVELFNSLMDGIKSPAGKEGLEAFTDTINSINKGSAALVDVAALIPEGTVEKVAQLSRNFIGVGTGLAPLLNLLEGLIDVIDRLNFSTESYVDNLNQNLANQGGGLGGGSQDLTNWEDPGPSGPGMTEFD